MANPTMVNAVGGGDTKQDLQLEELSQIISGKDIRYDPEHWPGLYVRFEENSPAIFIFGTGKYNIAGAKSESELLRSNKKILTQLRDVGYTVEDDGFEIRNLVFLDKFSMELDLEALSLKFGLEETEYNPGKFPGMVHSPTEFEGTFVIFRSGNIIYTGSSERKDAERAFESLFETLDSLFS